MYREEAKEAPDGAGYQSANADTMEDLYADDVPSSNERVESPAEPAQPAATPAVPATPAPAAAPAPVAPAVPAVTPQAETPPVQPSAPAAPVAPEVPAAQPAAPAPVEPQAPVQPTPPAEPQETEAQRNERLAGERVKLVGQLEQMYAIPEAELDTFRDTPETYLPKMAAKLHVEVLTAVANGVYAQLPNLVRGILNADRQQTSYEDKFFTRWSKLNTPDLRPKVLEMVGRYRGMNPTASFETLMDEVGAMAHVRFRIPYEDQQPVTPPPAQATPATPGGVRPFVPAGAGAASPPASSASENPFTQLANEFLADGQGF